MATLTTEYQLLAESTYYTFLSSYNGKVCIRLYARYSGQSVANNTSLVYVKLTRNVIGDYSNVKYGCYQKDAAVSGDLKATYSNSDYASFYAGNEYTIIEQAYTVNHNADGTKSLTLAATYDDSYISALSISSVSCTLPTIPRASTPTLGAYSIELGSSVSIYTNAASSAFRHIISYNWYSTEDGEPVWITIGTGVVDEVLWTLPLTFANNLPGTDRGTGSIKCETYNGDTRLGTSIIEFEGVVPSTSDFWPTIDSVLIDEPTGHMAKYGALVKGYSTLSVKAQASAKYGADIEKYTVIVDGKTYEGEDITTEPIMQSTDIVTVEVHVVDSRGIGSPVYSETFTLLEYSPPAVTALSVHRCDADGTDNDKGEYVSAKFTASITPLRNYNAHVYTLRYTPMGVSNATPKTLTVDVSSASDPYNLVDFVIPPVNMDGSYTWSIELEAKDDITKGNRTTSVSTAFTLMSWGKHGTGMAIGKVNEKENTLEVALDMDVTGEANFEEYIHLRKAAYLYDALYSYGLGFFFGDVNFYGAVTGSVNSAIKDYVVETGTEAMGSNGTWYWRKWESGRAECYGVRNYGNVGATSAWSGGTGCLSPAYHQALPSGLFIAAPEVQEIKVIKTSDALIPIVAADDTTAESTGLFYLWRPAEAITAKQVHLGFHCIGRWK